MKNKNTKKFDFDKINFDKMYENYDIKIKETKDDKIDFLKNFPEYFEFEKNFRYNSSFDKSFKKISSQFTLNKDQFIDVIKDIIQKVIGDAAEKLGLKWTVIDDGKYFFGFYKINGSDKKMEILVPYAFKFKNLKDKIIEWFYRQKKGQYKKPKIQIVESFTSKVINNVKDSSQEEKRKKIINYKFKNKNEVFDYIEDYLSNNNWRIIEGDSIKKNNNSKKTCEICTWGIFFHFVRGTSDKTLEIIIDENRFKEKDTIYFSFYYTDDNKVLQNYEYKDLIIGGHTIGKWYVCSVLSIDAALRYVEDEYKKYSEIKESFTSNVVKHTKEITQDDKRSNTLDYEFETTEEAYDYTKKRLISHGWKYGDRVTHEKNYRVSSNPHNSCITVVIVTTLHRNKIYDKNDPLRIVIYKRKEKELGGKIYFTFYRHKEQDLFDEKYHLDSFKSDCDDSWYLCTSSNIDKAIKFVEDNYEKYIDMNESFTSNVIKHTKEKSQKEKRKDVLKIESIDDAFDFFISKLLEDKEHKGENKWTNNEDSTSLGNEGDYHIRKRDLNDNNPFDFAPQGTIMYYTIGGMSLGLYFVLDDHNKPCFLMSGLLDSFLDWAFDHNVEIKSRLVTELEDYRDRNISSFRRIIDCTFESLKGLATYINKKYYDSNHPLRKKVDESFTSKVIDNIKDTSKEEKRGIVSNIKFKDPLVEKICHEHGVYTYADAAKVTTIIDDTQWHKPSWFYDHGIKSFNEFKYFTGLKSVERHAFNFNTKLKSIIIPNSVKKIELGAFKDCLNLTNIVLQEGIEEIETAAFINCKSLKSLFLPDGLKKINSLIIEGCYNFTSINIPDSVNEIKDRAFKECSNSLKTIYISKNHQLKASLKMIYPSIDYIDPNDVNESFTSKVINDTIKNEKNIKDDLKDYFSNKEELLKVFIQLVDEKDNKDNDVPMLEKLNSYNSYIFNYYEYILKKNKNTAYKDLNHFFKLDDNPILSDGILMKTYYGMFFFVDPIDNTYPPMIGIPGNFANDLKDREEFDIKNKVSNINVVCLYKASHKLLAQVALIFQKHMFDTYTNDKMNESFTSNVIKKAKDNKSAIKEDITLSTGITGYEFIIELRKFKSELDADYPGEFRLSAGTGGVGIHTRSVNNATDQFMNAGIFISLEYDKATESYKGGLTTGFFQIGFSTVNGFMASISYDIRQKDKDLLKKLFPHLIFVSDDPKSREVLFTEDLINDFKDNVTKKYDKICEIFGEVIKRNFTSMNDIYNYNKRHARTITKEALMMF